MRPLSLLETRVLGVLIEKQHTVPDSYPLSLNTLTLGCNQKSARDPVIETVETEVQATIDELKQLGLAMEAPGSRVTRYAHNTERVLRLPSQSVALLATLMLRGTQTSGELRINSERLHKFSDISAVEGFLDELATRADDVGGPLVVKLARVPGEREARWAHLLSGAVALPSASTTDTTIASSEIAVMKHEIAGLRGEVARLTAELANIKSQLGI